MEKNRKLGLGVLGLLLLGTLGAHAAYARHASDRESWETAPRKTVPAPMPGENVPGFVKSANEPASPGDVSLNAEVDRTAVLQGGDGILHVQVTIDTHGLGVSEPVPTDFVVVFDRSGSMGGDKLEYGKQALRQLIARLGDNDRFALVAYDSRVQVRVPLASTARDMRSTWLEIVNQLDTAGGTNISAGLDSGLDELARVADPSRASRVLLLSDGLANEGATSLPELLTRAQRIVRRDSVLTTVGIGSDFDERVMTSLAKGGAGAFYYLAKLETLTPLLDAELKTAGQTYARGAELSIRLPPSVSLLSATGGTSVQSGEQVRIPVGSLYGERKSTLWLTLKVPTDRLRDSDLGAISLRYRRDDKLFQVEANALPKVACVSEEKEFRRRIVEKVWEHAMLDEELGKGSEALGDAIRSGDPRAVDDAVANANRELKLAQELGNQNVVVRMQAMAAAGPAAKAAQVAPMAVRSSAAKKATAEGFGVRNQRSYNEGFKYSASY